MIGIKFLFAIGLIACLNGEAFSFSCKNEAGKDVDWFVLLKPPKQKSTHKALSVGGGYGFIDNTQKEAGWTLSDKDIGDETSYIGKTFEEVYKSPEKYSYIQWNDAKYV